MPTPTLTELQTERARLKALEAQRELSEALAQTRRADDLHVAAVAVRNLITAALAELPRRFAEVIAGEHEETRVHYLLSDAVHQLLDTLAAQAVSASSALPEFGARFGRGAKPRDLLTVSQHADRHRWIASGTNAPGQWRTSLTPYLQDIMDDLSEHSPVRTVVFCKSAGVGGTEAMFNWLSYVMQHLGNRDLMVVVPSLELRDRSFNPRLAKMISENAGLAELVSRASRSSANRADILEYGANCRLIKAGANSADSLRSDHLPYVICDEVDAYKWDVGGEGDPMTLIENRQRTFSRAKTFLISTPTNEGESRIWQAYLRSDRRRYHVPCPHCGTSQPLVWSPETMRYRTAIADPAGSATGAETEQMVVVDAWYVCTDCGAEIREGNKPSMLAAGRWVAERPHVKLTRGYHINALYAPIGLGLTWKQICQKWVDAQNDSSALKAFVNTYLGEVWREEGDGADASTLQARVEQWHADEIRAKVRPLRIVAGVDVQKDRLEATIAGFSTDEQCWVLDHLIIPGDTTAADTWSDLHAALSDAGVTRAAVDSGYNTSYAVAFCERYPWATPTKGIAGRGRTLIEDDRKRRQRLRVKRKRGQPIEPIGVDQGKSIIYARLKLPHPGPGYFHFPADPAFDDQYFLQLAAEELRTKVKNGRPFAEWVQIRPRNEALDCLLLCLVAHRLAGELKPVNKPARTGQSTSNSTAPQPAQNGIAAHVTSENRITLSNWSRA
jgi:phage terminase large subunit GpA-like protein